MKQNNFKKPDKIVDFTLFNCQFNRAKGENPHFLIEIYYSFFNQKVMKEKVILFVIVVAAVIAASWISGKLGLNNYEEYAP